MDSAHQPTEIHRKIVEFIDSGRSFALVTILKADGSTPQKAGVKAIVDKTGKIWGTLGGGSVEAEAQRRTIEVCKLKQPVVFDFHLEGACAGAPEPICGGTMRMLIDPTIAKNRTAYAEAAEAIRQRQRGALITAVSAGGQAEVTVEWFSRAGVPSRTDFPPAESIHSCLKHEEPQLFTEDSQQSETHKQALIEPIIPKPHLLIAGGGHIGQALAHQAVCLGFDVTVMDDRPEFTNKALFTQPVTTQCGDISKLLTDFSIAEDTYIVIVTRGHRQDAEALEACIHSGAAYIGMIGSKRKVALMRKNFIESGLATEEEFNQVFAPVGLDIGAITVEEISTSIAAQLVAIRRKGRDGPHGGHEAGR
jgi:xanthine dehydrogenase accessory factor